MNFLHSLGNGEGKTWLEKYGHFVAAGLFLAVVGGIFLSDRFVPSIKEKLVPVPNYQAAYSLVADKISSSAEVAISLPEGQKASEVVDKVTLTPSIKGKWFAVGDNKLVLKPANKLSVGKYYLVTLATDKGTVGKGFKVEEDPKVDAIFPAEGTEANEKSNITVVFNRPMVPLTTLSDRDQLDIPVRISPETKGKLKWVGTRTVQFVPETNLIPSTNYHVQIVGLKSEDGVQAEGTTKDFTTRHLRYTYLNNGGLVYNQPIVIPFNQPVNLERTKNEISVKNSNGDKPVEVIVEYAKEKVYNKETKKFEEKNNESVLHVYPAKDSHGRAKLWDFSNSYNLKINKAYPKDGDIEISESKDLTYGVYGEIAGIFADSPRSNYVSQDLFDPQGHLIVQFYEEIDKDKTQIVADKLTKIEYGTKCIDGTDAFNPGMDGKDGYGAYVTPNCQKETDKKKLVLTFEAGKIAKGEILKINFKKLVNATGLKINVADIEREAKVVPELVVFDTFPKNSAVTSSLTDFFLCSNTPLQKAPKEDALKLIQISPEWQYVAWNASQMVPDWVDSQPVSNYRCKAKQYQTILSYGLMPETDYKMQFKINDQFDGHADKSVAFKTDKIDSQVLNFYHYQRDRYSVTTPAHTELNYGVENMTFVDMSICKLSAENMLHNLEYSLSYTQSPAEISGCIKTVQKRIELPHHYWIKNFFKVNLKDYSGDDLLGHYIISFSNSDYKDPGGTQVFERTYVTVTNLGLVEKRIEVNDSPDAAENQNLGETNRKQIKNLYWLTNLSDLSPVSGAKLDLFSDKKEASVTTDAEGLAKVAPLNKQLSVIAYAGNDSAIISSNVKFNSGEVARKASRIFVYTDRPIYRPGHTVDIKGLYRIGFDGNYQILTGQKAHINVFDGAGAQILNSDIEINDFGTFNTNVILDPTAPLGTYRIEVDSVGYGYFDVEEYKPAAFKVDMNSDHEEYIAGDSFALNVDAKYYFDAPVDKGTVEYSILSQSYYFDKYTDQYFAFGNAWYNCYDSCSYGDQFVLRGSMDLNGDGKAQIKQKLDFNKFFKEGDRASKIFVVYATVKNASGQAVTTQKSFVVHAGEYYLGLSLDNSFLAKGDKAVVKMKSVDTLGKVRSVVNVQVSYNKIIYTQNKRQEVDGGYYYTWQQKLVAMKNETVDTNSNGDWQGEFAPTEEGQYVIIAKGTDARGNNISTSYGFYVYGEQHVDVQPSNDTNLQVVVDKPNVKVGDTAQIIIKSPFEFAKALITVERGEVYDYKVVDIKGSLYKYEFKIDEKYTPNVFVTAVLVSNKPEIRYGQAYFSVDAEKKELKISVTSDKQSYLPGEEVKLHFAVKDSNGQGVSTELSAAVVDKSVLALKGNPKLNPTAFFYSGFPLTVSTLSNMKNVLYTVDVPSATGSKGGGGAGEADLAKKKRGEFKDTAFWQAVVTTDKEGNADLRFKLPDNLTTWQTEVVGLTKDNKFGVGYYEFKEQKDVLLVPIAPRFVLPGDQFSVGANIVNRTDKKQKLSVTIASADLTLPKNVSQDVTIAAGESKNIYFSVSAPNSKIEGVETFTIVAKNSDYNDTVEQTIKINRNETYEVVATGGYTNDAQVTESVIVLDSVVTDRGGLTIKSSATIAVFMQDAVKYLLEYPYGSTEELASKLEAITLAKEIKGLKNVGESLGADTILYNGTKYSLDDGEKVVLADLMQRQNQDGGFSYYKPLYNYYYGQYSSIYLSLRVAEALAKIKKAGYAVDDVKLTNLSSYLDREGGNNLAWGNDYNLNILLTHALSGLKPYVKTEAVNLPRFIAAVKQSLKDKSFINEHASNGSLISLAILVKEQEAVFGKGESKRLLELLESRLQIDARGAYLAPNQNLLWQYYETEINDTGYLLKALALAKRDDKVLDRMLRYLLVARAKDGSWGSMPNTFSVVDAMTEYIQWKQENESDFTLNLFVNEVNKNSFRFATSTVMQQNTLAMPIAELTRGGVTPVKLVKENHNDKPNTFYYDLAFKYFLPIEQIGPRDEGFTITRNLYAITDTASKSPVSEGKVGDVIRVHDEIIVPRSRNYVSLEDFIPAGVQIVNTRLATEDQSLAQQQYVQSKPEDAWRKYEPPTSWPLYPSFEEIRDDKIYAVIDHLEPGMYTYEYYVRLQNPGTYQYLPAVVSEKYFPENFGRTGGGYFVVREK